MPIDRKAEFLSILKRTLIGFAIVLCFIVVFIGMTASIHFMAQSQLPIAATLAMIVVYVFIITFFIIYLIERE